MNQPKDVDVRNLPCPRCKATVYEWCLWDGESREQNHPERVEVWVKTMKDGL